MEGPNENCHHLAEAASSPKRHPRDTLAGILRLGSPLGLLAALLRVGMAAGPRGADWDLPPPCRDRCDDPDWTKRAAPCAGPGIAQNAPSAHSFRAPFGVPDLYHMAKPRRVAIPVAEDRPLHAVLNGKNGTAPTSRSGARKRLLATIPLDEDQPRRDPNCASFMRLLHTAADFCGNHQGV
jgi:hypothetical protein